jgi:hypothetical protein
MERGTARTRVKFKDHTVPPATHLFRLGFEKDKREVASWAADPTKS